MTSFHRYTYLPCQSLWRLLFRNNLAWDNSGRIQQIKESKAMTPGFILLGTFLSYCYRCTDRAATVKKWIMDLTVARNAIIQSDTLIIISTLYSVGRFPILLTDNPPLLHLASAPSHIFSLVCSPPVCWVSHGYVRISLRVTNICLRLHQGGVLHFQISPTFRLNVVGHYSPARTADSALDPRV